MIRLDRYTSFVCNPRNLKAERGLKEKASRAAFLAWTLR
ncbi:hypothetical protein Mhypo_03522 [Meiothermus hypogaeus]|uniref:Transposase n=1 Tax=Meiothermus hypogaeus TaxID=884155 RepID=A0ABX9MGV1_9DEIN|nr:hypothetical protein Mhypo_03522 [Meiothermus hypogaeus]